MSHICLIPSTGGADNGGMPMFTIYRGDDEGQQQQQAPIAFGPNHEWLKHAVALALDQDSGGTLTSPITGGSVDDGDFTTTTTTMASHDDEIDVEDGVGGEYAVVHQACWQLAGQPQYLEERLARIYKTRPYREVAARYHSQYFEFDKLLENGEEWMICEPTDNNNDNGRRNQERIQTWLKLGKEELDPEEKGKTDSETKRKANQPIRPPPLPDGFDNKTLYEWLGLDPPNQQEDSDNNTITEANINRAFKRKRLKLHPNAANGGNARQYEQVRKAHAILTQYRNDYDHCDFANESQVLKFAYTWDRVGSNLI